MRTFPKMTRLRTKAAHRVGVMKLKRFLIFFSPPFVFHLLPMVVECGGWSLHSHHNVYFRTENFGDGMKIEI
eukprot:NP_495205.1 Uncharacterized protein CELE_R12C12.4 [Caenorhabditis elegans]